MQENNLITHPEDNGTLRTRFRQILQSLRQFFRGRTNEQTIHPNPRLDIDTSPVRVQYEPPQFDSTLQQVHLDINTHNWQERHLNSNHLTDILNSHFDLAPQQVHLDINTHNWQERHLNSNPLTDILNSPLSRNIRASFFSQSTGFSFANSSFQAAYNEFFSQPETSPFADFQSAFNESFFASQAPESRTHEDFVTHNQKRLEALKVEDKDIPEAFRCQLLQQVMDTPVKLQNGDGETVVTIELKFLKEYKKRNNFAKLHNPYNRQIIDVNKDIEIDYDLKHKIHDFIAKKTNEANETNSQAQANDEKAEYDDKAEDRANVNCRTNRLI